MKPVRKAVFPVAGLGIRFLPATKAIPKEMLTVLDLERAVEIILDRMLAAAGDEDHLLDPRGTRLVDRILDERPVDNRQQFLGYGLGCGQEAGTEAGDWEDRFANAFMSHA